MILIVAVDDSLGVSFNRRRQSQDRVLRDKILSLTKGKRLWVTPYTAQQFESVSEHPELNVSENPLTEAVAGEYAFVENMLVGEYIRWVEKIVLFRWNRAYPSDLKFDIDVTDNAHWRLVQTEDFAGYSHDKITMEVYEAIVSRN